MFCRNLEFRKNGKNNAHMMDIASDRKMMKMKDDWRSVQAQQSRSPDFSHSSSFYLFMGRPSSLFPLFPVQPASIFRSLYLIMYEAYDSPPSSLFFLFFAESRNPDRENRAMPFSFLRHNRSTVSFIFFHYLSN